MRVAYLFEFPTLLGGERSWLAALPHLQDVEPLAVSQSRGALAETLADEGIDALPFAWPRSDPETRARALLPLLRNAGVGLVHANSLTTSLVAPAVARGLGVPAVGHARDIMKLSTARVARLNGLDRLVCVSRAVARALAAQGVEEQRLVVQHNGIDARGAFDPSSLTPTLHDAMGLGPAVPVVGFVGQLVLRKDPLTFVRAVAALRRDHPAVRGVVVGARHSEKDEAVAYEARVRSEGEGGVAFLGERDDVPRLMAGMTAVASTSRQDPLSRVLLEALALARPVVATDVGGTSEMVIHGETGLLVDPGDPGACGRALSRLLDDPALAASLGSAGRRRVLERFTPEACGRGILAVYRELLGN